MTAGKLVEEFRKSLKGETECTVLKEIAIQLFIANELQKEYLDYIKVQDTIANDIEVERIQKNHGNQQKLLDMQAKVVGVFKDMGPRGGLDDR